MPSRTVAEQNDKNHLTIMRLYHIILSVTIKEAKRDNRPLL